MNKPEKRVHSINPALQAKAPLREVGVGNPFCLYPPFRADVITYKMMAGVYRPYGAMHAIDTGILQGCAPSDTAPRWGWSFGQGWQSYYLRPVPTGRYNPGAGNARAYKTIHSDGGNARAYMYNAIPSQP